MPFVYLNSFMARLPCPQLATKTLTIAMTFVLAACSNSALLTKQVPEYTQAKMLPRIKVPNHLNSQPLQGSLLDIPEIPNNPQLTQSLLAALPDVKAVNVIELQAQNVETINVDKVHFQNVFANLGNEQYRLMGANQNKYIVAHSSYQSIWKKLLDYWRQKSDSLDNVDSDTGIIETAWQPIPGSLQPGNSFTRGLSAVLGQDDDKTFYKVRISVTPSIEQNALSLDNASQYTQVSLDYSEQSLNQREQNTSPNWSDKGLMKERLLLDLLNGLTETDVQAQLSALQTSNRELPTSLLGVTRAGAPVAFIKSDPQNTLALLLKTMQEINMDVGSYDRVKQTIYFTHTSNINLSAVDQSKTNDTGGFWSWFKSLHTKDDNQSQGIKLNGDNSQATDASIIYSAKGVQPSRPIALEDRKGHKVKLGNKVLFVFEDKDQGRLNEQDEYEYTDYYQLQLMPNLQGVYVQVLTQQDTPANKLYAEEILANIVQSIVARS